MLTPDFARFVGNELRRRARRDFRHFAADLLCLRDLEGIPPHTRADLSAAVQALRDAEIRLEKAADGIWKEGA